MSRLEKSRVQKQQGKKKAFITFTVTFLVVLAAGTYYLFQDGSPVLFGSEEPDFIDRDRTEAFVDIFGLTYVRVYLVEDVKASDVTVNGEEMRYSAEHERWELVISGHEEGDILKIVVRSDEVRTRTQEVNVTVKDM